MISEETIALYAEVGSRMAKHAAVIQIGKAGRVSGAPLLRAPSVKGIKAPRAERAPNLGFPTVPKPPSRV